MPRRVEPAQLLGERRCRSTDRRSGAARRPARPRARVTNSASISSSDQRRGVDDARVRRTKLKQFARHERAGIEADRTARDQVAAAHGDEVGGARPGADEMHGHDAAPPPARRRARRSRRRRQGADRQAAPWARPRRARPPRRPMATPISAKTRAERVCARGLARLQDRRPSPRRSQRQVRAAAVRRPGSCCLVADCGDGVELLRRDAVARQRGTDRGARCRGAPAPRRQPMPATIMAFSQPHCVTGIAGRQPELPPTASGARDRDAHELAAERALARQQRGFGLERHRVDDQASARRAARASAASMHARHRSRRRR